MIHIFCTSEHFFKRTHLLNRIQTPRKQGGLGDMKIPLLADKTGTIARKYGVMVEDAGVAFRCVFYFLIYICVNSFFLQMWVPVFNTIKFKSDAVQNLGFNVDTFPPSSFPQSDRWISISDSNLILLKQLDEWNCTQVVYLIYWEIKTCIKP